jgi:hypothetical protein
MTPRAAVCSSTICPGADQLGQAPVWSDARRSRDSVFGENQPHIGPLPTHCRRDISTLRDEESTWVQGIGAKPRARATGGALQSRSHVATAEPPNSSASAYPRSVT